MYFLVLSAKSERAELMLLCCAQTHSWDIFLSPLQLPSSSFSLFCSSKGTCCVEVTLSRPQLQREGERKEVEGERQNTFPGGGERRGGGSEDEPAFCSSAECTTSLSHPVFFFLSPFSLHIVSCADILFFRAVSFWAPSKSPGFHSPLRSPLRCCAFSSPPSSLRRKDEK